MFVCVFVPVNTREHPPDYMFNMPGDMLGRSHTHTYAYTVIGERRRINEAVTNSNQ